MHLQLLCAKSVKVSIYFLQLMCLTNCGRAHTHIFFPCALSVFTTQAMIEAHLMRPELIPDLHTKMRVQSLVQELLWKLAEVSVE